MIEKLELLQEYKTSGNKSAFFKVLIDFLPDLLKVVDLKLKQMEKNGLVPANMYSAQEIVDDVYLQIFEKFTEDYSNPNHLKVQMYLMAREILEKLKEKHTKKRVSIEKLYREELKELEEDYTVDADGDLVLIEELDDISYHLDDYKDKIILLDTDKVDELTKELDLNDGQPLSESESKEISRAYSNLPELSQSVISHFVFGKLSVDEIAEVHKIPTEVVKEIIDKVKKRLKGAL